MTVIGEPGIGKSRLARELAARLGDRATVLEGRCLPYGQGITYWPVREMVLQAARGRPLEALTAGAGRRRGRRGLGRRHARPGRERARRGDAVGLPAAVRRGRARRPAGAPVRGRPLGGAAAARPRGRPRRAADRRAGAAALPRPSRAARRPPGVGARGARCGSDRSAPTRAAGCWPAARRSRIAADGGRGARRRQPALPRAAGRARGRARRRAGACRPRCTRCWPRGSTCSTRAERALLDAAAIEGERFHLGGVLALVEDVREPDAAQPGHARRPRAAAAGGPAEIAGEQAWRFRHALVRDAAYASMPKARAAEGHERLAGWLAGSRPRPRGRRADRRAPRARPRAAVELERCGGELRARSPRRAAQRLAAAGGRAHRRGDLPSEIAFLSRAGELLAGDDRARAELLPALAGALFEAGTLDRGGRGGGGGARARRAARPARASAGAPPSSASACASSAIPRRSTRTRRWRCAATRSAALSGSATISGSPARTTSGASSSGSRAAPRSGYRSAERVVHHARRAGSGFEIDTGVELHGVGARRQRGPGVGGDPPLRPARARGRRALRRAERARVPRRARRDGRALRARAQRARAGARRAGRSSGSGRPRSGWRCTTRSPRSLAGDAAAAERALEDAERIAVEIGDRWFLSTILVDRAHAVLAQGDVGARGRGRRADRGRPGAERHGVAGQARTPRAASSPRCEGDEAVALRRGARRRPRSPTATEMFTFRADAYRDLAECRRAVRATPDAERAARTALALYAAKENVAGAAQVMQAAPSPPDGA